LEPHLLDGIQTKIEKMSGRFSFQQRLPNTSVPSLPRPGRNDAGTVGFAQLLDKELPRDAGTLLFSFARDANALPGRDAGCVSDQSIDLLIALALELETISIGDSAASE
jgi:hypothetical protein